MLTHIGVYNTFTMLINPHTLRLAYMCIKMATHITYTYIKSHLLTSLHTYTSSTKHHIGILYSTQEKVKKTYTKAFNLI